MVKFRKTSPELRTLLEIFHQHLASRAGNAATRDALLDLLRHLTTPAGRTDANCSVTDSYFAELERTDAWNHLTPAFQELLNGISGALHDSIYAPDIAATFENLPEQLLSRAESLTIEE